MAALDNLRREVEEAKTAQASAIALIQGLKTRLDEALASSDQEAALQALADDLDAQQQSLAAAVTANTPQDPALPPAEPEQPSAPV